MKEHRIVIAAYSEESQKELVKLHKKINTWRVKNGNTRPLSLLNWAMMSQKALENKDKSK